MNKIKIGSPETKRLREILQSMDFFANMAVADLDYIIDYVEFYECEEGQRLIKQGQNADGLFMIFDGEVTVKRKAWFLAPSKPIKTLGPGDFFGEVALVTGGERNATVETTKPTKVFVLHQKQVEQLFEDNPPFRDKLSKIAHQRTAN